MGTGIPQDKEMTIEIHKPLENIKIAGENIKAVGIPEWRLKNEPSLVTIDIKYQYKSKSLVKGQRQFPHKYTIAKSEILKCGKRQQQTAQGEQIFYVVPISKMTEMPQKEIAPKAEPPIIIKTEPQSKIPTKPCWVCGCTKFAKMPWAYICCLCHPSPNPNIVEEIIDVAERVETKWKEKSSVFY